MQEPSEDAMTDVLLDCFFVLFATRAFATMILALIAGLMLVLPGYKLTLLCLLIYGVHRTSLGRRRLEQLVFLFLVVATVVWLDIMPSREWFARAKTDIATQLAVK